ncbi:PEP-CTERM sorting domain-containing protein, partial [Pseudomaricurvus sp.]|uniref:PEP-CTERM sorting domain-containing protein n=1 Tax=Pseudomaricurvus sp. TaxID=2004510 RepID=UPI003F6B3BFF
FTSGAYSAFWDNADTTWFDATDTPLFATDATGIVATSNFQGTSSFTGIDNTGSSAYMYQTGVETSLDEIFVGTDFNGASGWVVSLDVPEQAVPAPATLALLGLGLLGLRLRRKA